MNTRDKEREALASRVWVVDRMIFIELTDGRHIGFPADRFRRLREADSSELGEVRLRLDGAALRWDNLDEDLSVIGILEGHFQLPFSDVA